MDIYVVFDGDEMVKAFTDEKRAIKMCEGDSAKVSIAKNYNQKLHEFERNNKKPKGPDEQNRLAYCFQILGFFPER